MAETLVIRHPATLKRLSGPGQGLQGPLSIQERPLDKVRPSWSGAPTARPPTAWRGASALGGHHHDQSLNSSHTFTPSAQPHGYTLQGFETLRRRLEGSCFLLPSFTHLCWLG